VCFVSLEDEPGIAQKSQGTIRLKARSIERLRTLELKSPGSHDFG